MNPPTIRFLDEVGDLSGATGLDLGCGIGETTRLLGTRVGDSGSVIGVDFDEALVETARSLTSVSNISFAQGDAHTLEFEDASYDLVFARFLLLHVAEPKKVLNEMLRVCRPDGTVIVHDGDFATLYTKPDSSGGEGLNKLFTLFPNSRIGTDLWHMFRECGYEHVEFGVDRMLLRDASAKRLALMTVEAMREAVMQSGLMPREEIDALCHTMRAGVDDESYLIGFPEVYAAWVKR